MNSDDNTTEKTINILLDRICRAARIQDRQHKDIVYWKSLAIHRGKELETMTTRATAAEARATAAEAKATAAEAKATAAEVAPPIKRRGRPKKEITH